MLCRNKNIFIDINGDVYPCNLFANHNEYFAGNVFSEDLLEIWRKSKVFIELRNLKKKTLKNVQIVQLVRIAREDVELGLYLKVEA